MNLLSVFKVFGVPTIIHDIVSLAALLDSEQA